jgi:hypothetical protein
LVERSTDIDPTVQRHHGLFSPHKPETIEGAPVSVESQIETLIAHAERGANALERIAAAAESTSSVPPGVEAMLASLGGDITHLIPGAAPVAKIIEETAPIITDLADKVKEEAAPVATETALIATTAAEDATDAANAASRTEEADPPAPVA